MPDEDKKQIAEDVQPEPDQVSEDVQSEAEDSATDAQPEASQPEPEEPVVGDKPAEPATPAPKKPSVPKKAVVGVAAAAAVVLALVGANVAGLFHQHTWKDATCTTAKTCEECGATEGDPLGHDYSEEDKAATCTEASKRIYTCKRCGDKYEEQGDEPATGHTPGEWTISTSQMKQIQRCSVCGQTLETAELTREALEQAMVGQQFTLDAIYKVESNSQYKSLYRDQIGIDVTNNSDKIVRSADILACSYDASGLPVTVDLMFHTGDDEVTLSLGDVNLAAGASWSSHAMNRGWDIYGDSTGKMVQFRGCIKQVEYTDGSTWTNPYADAWSSLYSGKSL